MIDWFGPTIGDIYLMESGFIHTIPKTYIETEMIKEIRKRLAIHDQHYNLEDKFQIIYPPTPTSRTYGYKIKLKKD